MDENNNALMVQTDDGMLVNDFDVTGLLNPQVNMVKLVAPGFEMDDADMFNAIQSPGSTVNDNIGKVINLSGVVVHSVTLVNSETGEVNVAPRIILMDKGGQSYVSVSKTLFNSLKNLFAFYRTPDRWPEGGIPVKLKQVTKGTKRFFSLEIVKG